MDHPDLHSKFCSNRLRADASSGAVAISGNFNG